MKPSLTQRLADDIKLVLDEFIPFRHGAEHVVVVATTDRIEIHGFVRTETIAHAALAEAKRLAGQVPVLNKLVMDNVLESQIARLLSADARTSLYFVRVSAYFGHVTLIGELPENARLVALEIARSVPGVRTVEEESLRLSPAAEPIATLFPARGD